ncbi:MAG TPA: hypothetical protein VI299_23165 [Polyangiales bacterium]
MLIPFQEEIRIDGARFAICQRYNVSRVQGRVLNHYEAARILDRALNRFGDDAAWRAIHARLSSSHDTHRRSNDEIHRWFSYELGLGNGGLARLVLVELADSDAHESSTRFRAPGGGHEAPAPPARSAPRKRMPELDWIALKFVDDAGSPMAGEPYEVTLADGSVQKGQLDAQGCAHLADIEPGDCVVSFPRFKPRLAS